MQFITNSQVFHDGLKKASSFFPTRSVISIIENFKISIKAGMAKVIATNLEMGCEVYVKVESKEDFDFLCRKVMMDTLAKLPDQPVTVKVTETKITLLAGKAKFEFTPEPAEEFPAGPEPGTNYTTIPALSLKEGFERVGFCASKDQGRPGIYGVFLGNDVMVGTDGFKLGAYESGFDGEDMIIPTYCVPALLPLLEDEEEIVMNRTDIRVYFVSNKWAVWARLADAKFPDYINVIPSYPEGISVNRKVLMQSVNRIRLYANQEHFSGILRWDGEVLKLQTENIDFALSAAEDISVTGDAAPWRKVLNLGYLKEVLNGIDEDSVSIMTGDSPHSALMIVANKVKYIIQPLRDI